MIVRIWSGVVAESDGDAYAAYMQRTGLAGYAATAGNQGAFMLRRRTDAGYEFVMLSLWESMEAIRAFAGDDPAQAVFYPDDDAYLVERDLQVRHYEVVATAGGAPTG